jgi:DNA recombination protein RmuC
MREQAHVIQEEVGKLMEDVGRLDERVRRLQVHFTQTGKDVDDILVSTKKITGRGEKIAAVDVDVEEQRPPPIAARPEARTPQQQPRREPVRDEPPELFSRFGDS